MKKLLAILLLVLPVVCGAQTLFHGPIVVGTGLSFSGDTLSTTQTASATNLVTVFAPDFSLDANGRTRYSFITTNAAFTFSAPVNVTATLAETTVVFVTNSTAVAVVVTPATAWKSQGMWYLTNVTAFTIFHYGNTFTNAVALPLY